MSTAFKCKIISHIRTKLHPRDASRYRSFTAITAENRIAFCSVKDEHDLKKVDQNAFTIIANCETASKGDKMFINIFSHTNVVIFIVIFIVLMFACMCIITFITTYC